MSFFRNPNTDFSTAPFCPEDGEYLVKIDRISAREVTVNGDTKNIISFQLSLASGPDEGRKIGNDHTCWVDDADGVTNTMQVVYASQGLTAGTDEADAQFKSQFPDMSVWAVDDENNLGDAWKQVQGSIVACRIKKKCVATKGRDFANFYNFRPASEL